MCLFKKKKKTVTFNHLYNIGDHVKFRHRGELSPGYIYGYKLDSNNIVVYDVQIGGECPTIINNIKESDIILPKK